MKKRWLSILLVCGMLLTTLPSAVFAEGEEPSGCVCTAACTAEARNPECSTCGAEDAALEDCAKYEAKQENEPNDTQEPADPQEKAQEESKVTEPAEEPTAPAKSQVAVQAAANNKAAAVQATHTHCACGGSISAGGHTSHSDVTYTAWNGTDIKYTDNVAYVYLTGNATLGGHLTVDGKTLYLCLNGKTLSSNGSGKIQVKNGGRLVLCDCQGGGTFKGATKNVWGGACVYLYTSTFDMFGGKLTGGKVTGSGGGGAIALDDEKCVFNMYGGEISGNNGKNYGGAIFRTFDPNKPNTTGGTFNMYGGTIKNNKAKNGGAFFSTTGGTIKMTGGTISGNTATQNSNDAGGGAIYMRGYGKINISGSAELAGNTSSWDGGAILMGSGTITISGNAKLTGNTASRWGGAICLRKDWNSASTINMTGGEISGNKASEGGAVEVLDANCTFNLSGGKITKNNSTGNGGAVYLNQEPSVLNMTGGEISGNTATGNGGGVYINRTGSVCNLSEGTISGNQAGGNGGGIYQNNGKLKLSGTPVVTGNTVSGKANNVYLPSGKTLTISGTMSSGASVGVKTANTNYPVVFSNAYGQNYETLFFADDTANAHVEYNDDQKLQLAAGAHKYNVTVTTEGSGTAQASAAKAAEGETVTLTATPDEGYHFKKWDVLSGDVTITGDTFAMPAENVSVKAIFEAHSFTTEKAEAQYLKAGSTCTEQAEYYKSCAVCGLSSKGTAGEATFFSGNILSHDYGAWTSNGDGTHTRVCSRDSSHTESGTCSGGTATCTKRAVCSACGGEYGKMEAHDFTAEKAEEQYQKSAATCTEKAVYYKSCIACGLTSKDTEQEDTFESGDPLNHDFSNWNSNGKDQHTRTCQRQGCDYTETDDCDGGTATCTEPATCTVCGGTYGELAAHDFTAEVAEAKYLKTEATCTEQAVYYKSCKACGLASEDTFQSGNPLGHDWGAWTSNGDGTHTRNCTKDSSHTEDGTCSGGTATCTERAICDVCGGAYGDLAAHDFTAEVAEENYLKSEATCTEPAVYYKSCKACGLTSEGTEQEDTFQYGNPLGHDYDTEWSQDETHHWYVCKRCQDVAELEEHTASGWITDKAATAKADGERHKECTVCGYILETDTIPATGSKTKPGKQDNTKTRTKTNEPKTGDDSTLLLWTALLGVSGVGATGVVRYGRKRKDNE